MSKVWNKLSSRILVYGGDWQSAQSTVRATTFAKMVELAKDKIQYYISDLYHDALWLNQELNGPGEFEWVVRESGTWIGETAKIIKEDTYAPFTRYKFEIREDDNQKWVLDTYESVEEQAPVPEIPWVDRHAALDISQCENATAIEGCIFHPAPVNGWTKEPEFTPEFKETTDEQRDDIIKMLFEPNIPTLRNDLTSALNVPDTRKEMKMDDIIRDLREKFNEAEAAKSELEDYQSSINDAVDELETYLSDLDDLINSLDSLPEISVYVDLDTVSFDS